MTNRYRALHKSVLATFYREHAGLMIVLLFIFFGLMSAESHVALAEYFVLHPAHLLIPAGFWCMAAGYLLHYNRGLTRRPYFSFVRLIIAMPPAQRTVSALLPIALQQLAPVLMYGWFLMFFALRLDRWNAAALILPVQLFVVAAVTFGWMRAVVSTHERTTIGIRLRTKFRMRTPGWLFFARWFLQRHWLQYCLLLACALLAVAAVTYLYDFDSYDERFYGLGALAAAGLLLAVVFSFVIFEHEVFPMMRHLPMHPGRRWANAAAGLNIHFLPPVLALIRQKPEQLGWIQTLEITFFVLSLPVFIYSLLLVRPGRPEQALPDIFFVFLALFICILSGVPAGVLGVLLFVLSWLIYRKMYHRFEIIPPASSQPPAF
jgi:hypothetical protein